MSFETSVCLNLKIIHNKTCARQLNWVLISPPLSMEWVHDSIGVGEGVISGDSAAVAFVST